MTLRNRLSHSPYPRGSFLVPALVAAALLVGPARAEEQSGHARFHIVDSNVTVQRYTETTSEEASANLPVFSGDRIWTDRSGRTEIQFPDGSILLVGAESRLDVELIDDEASKARIRLWSGSIVVGRMDQSSSYDFEIQTDEAVTNVEEHSLVRVDAFAGETRTAALSGKTETIAAERRRELEEGDEVWMRSGFEPTRGREIDRDSDDDLDTWARERWNALDYEGQSRRYLPEPLQAYGEDFDNHGSWGTEVGVGSVWYPSVGIAWQPYQHGRWCWTPYGWNWVPAESWGWSVSHYGRLGLFRVLPVVLVSRTEVGSRSRRLGPRRTLRRVVRPGTERSRGALRPPRQRFVRKPLDLRGLAGHGSPQRGPGPHRPRRPEDRRCAHRRIARHRPRKGRQPPGRGTPVGADTRRAETAPAPWQRRFGLWSLVGTARQRCAAHQGQS